MTRLQLREGAVVAAVLIGIAAGMCGTAGPIICHRGAVRPAATTPAPAPHPNPSPVLPTTGGAR